MLKKLYGIRLELGMSKSVAFWTNYLSYLSPWLFSSEKKA
jgi:hypothetical protein